MIFATFLIWIAAQMTVTELVGLHLYIDTQPVIYGQDLSFICSFDVQEETISSQWYWFKNDRILFQDGSPRKDVDIFKYKENRVTENIRNLIISNFEFSDIQNYKCRHAFKEASLDLDTEAYTFVYLGNRTTMVTRLLDNRFIVELFNVSPVPTCNITVKNSYLPMTEQSSCKDVYLYNISFQQTVQCGYGDIISNVECDVGGFQFNKVLNISCGLSDPQDKTYPYILAIEVSVIWIAVIIITSVIACIVDRKRKQTSSRYLDSDVEDGHQRETFL